MNKIPPRSLLSLLVYMDAQKRFHVWDKQDWQHTQYVSIVQEFNVLYNLSKKRSLYHHGYEIYDLLIFINNKYVNFLVTKSLFCIYSSCKSFLRTHVAMQFCFIILRMSSCLRRIFQIFLMQKIVAGISFKVYHCQTFDILQ